MADLFGAVDAAETHISQLFFTNDRVFKLLKPVENNFLSFVDRETRLKAARQEYELNRRLSPDVYLGLANVIEDGVLVDHMIVMKRLPENRQLHHLVDDPGFDDYLRQVAKYISRFHAAEPAIHGADASAATAADLHQNWLDNFVTLSPLSGTVLDKASEIRMRNLVDRFVVGCAPLFAERIEQGWIRNGHGDFRAEHVFCLDDGPRVIDCLAFSDHYRIGDVLNDVAFLAMDLHRLAGADAAETFLNYYAEFANEHHPAALAYHYIAYRALVRAKVAALRYKQGDQSAVDEVRTYFDLALNYLERGRVQLVLVGGGAGVGKSTVAEGLANRMGATWLRSDEIRQELFGQTPPPQVGPKPGTGRYSPDNKDRIYTELLQRSEALLRRGECVVLDATWSTALRREWAHTLATATNAEIVELHCVAPLALAQERIAQRRASVYDPSEATEDVAAHIEREFEDWPTARIVDTSGPIHDSIAAAYEGVASYTKPESLSAAPS